MEPYNPPDCLHYARLGKRQKLYQFAISDLDSRGYHAKLTTIEIGALGYWLLKSRRFRSYNFLTYQVNGCTFP